MIDVYTFDGKVRNIFKCKYTIEEKDTLFKNFLKELRNIDAIFIVNKMVNDMHSPNGENNLDSADILKNN